MNTGAECTSRWTVWGYRPSRVASVDGPWALLSGSLRECGVVLRRRQAEGWRCLIYREGVAPVGLRLLFEEDRAGSATIGRRVVNHPAGR